MPTKVKVLNLHAAVAAINQVIGAEGMRAVARNISDAARARWVKQASQKLTSSRFDYINGIQPVEETKGGFSITLVGAVPNMVENGWKARNLHDTLLKPGAPGVKVSKDGGRYRAIPFRHKGPGAGPTGGQAMGSQFAAKKAASAAAPHTVIQDTLSLGKAIHGKAKRLKEGQRLPKGLVAKLRGHHTTDIFAGMKVNKQAITGKKGGVRFQRKYTTFRMIAVDSGGNPKPGGKWAHPGINPRHLVDDVAKFAEEIAPKALEAYINGVFGA